MRPYGLGDYVAVAMIVMLALLVGHNVGINKAKKRYNVERVVCDSVEWHHHDDTGVYGGEDVATCTANDVYGRKITVHIID